MAYGRGSAVSGQFRDSWEAGVGAKWYFVPTERMWLTGEVMRTVNVPYSGVFTPYTGRHDRLGADGPGSSRILIIMKDR